MARVRLAERRSDPHQPSRFIRRENALGQKQTKETKLLLINEPLCGTFAVRYEKKPKYLINERRPRMPGVVITPGPGRRQRSDQRRPRFYVFCDGSDIGHARWTPSSGHRATPRLSRRSAFSRLNEHQPGVRSPSSRPSRSSGPPARASARDISAAAAAAVQPDRVDHNYEPSDADEARRDEAPEQGRPPAARLSQR